MTARISVVIPAYRAGATIRRAVESVLCQTAAATEVLVIDDGSPEPLRPSLSSYGPLVRVLRQENGGAASARNRGITEARGDLLAFLDADDYWEAEKLERHLELYGRWPSLGLTFGPYWAQEPGQARRPIELGVRRNPREPFRVSGEDAFRLATRIWTGAVVVPRYTLGEDRFVSGLEPAEDRDLWFRLVLKEPVAMVAERLATAVLEADSLSRSNIDRDCGNMLRVVRRHGVELGHVGLRFWEADVFRRWAAAWLGEGRPSLALRPALSRLVRQPGQAEAWWVAAKSLISAVRERLWLRRLPPRPSP